LLRGAEQGDLLPRSERRVRNPRPAAVALPRAAAPEPVRILDVSRELRAMRLPVWAWAAWIVSAAVPCAAAPTDVRVPEVSRRAPAAYPEAARRAGIQGTVVVGAWIDASGVVRKTHIVKSVPGLDEAAKQCVRKWTFQPARYRGKTIAAWITVPV